MLSFFHSFSSSFRLLLNIRETIAKYFGLKTAQKTSQEEREKIRENFEANIGDKIAIFEVLQKNDTELLTGQKDKHLDFKLSFIRYEEDDFIVLKLITSVKIHNTLGRIYFSIIKPIHRFYMRRILKRMEKILIEESK